VLDSNTRAALGHQPGADMARQPNIRDSGNEPTGSDLESLWWACEDLNLGPLPYQIFSGLLDRLGPRSQRSRLTSIDSLLASVVCGGGRALLLVRANRDALSVTADDLYGLSDRARSGHGPNKSRAAGSADGRRAF